MKLVRAAEGGIQNVTIARGLDRLERRGLPFEIFDAQVDQLLCARAAGELPDIEEYRLESHGLVSVVSDPDPRRSRTSVFRRQSDDLLGLTGDRHHEAHFQ